MQKTGGEGDRLGRGWEGGKVREEKEGEKERGTDGREGKKRGKGVEEGGKSRGGCRREERRRGRKEKISPHGHF